MPGTNRPKKPASDKKLKLTSINGKPIKKVPGAVYYTSSGQALDKNRKPIKRGR